MSFWTEQLRVRFRPSVAITSAVILIATGFAIASYQDALFRAQRLREMNVQAEILAASVTAAVTFGDYRAAQEYVDALKVNPEIEAVGVLDARSRLVAQWLRPKAARIPDAGLAATSGGADGRTVVVPILENRARLGLIYLRGRPEPVERRLARYAPTMLLALMAAFLLGALGTAQRALRQVNSELGDRAQALAAANSRLQIEMGERAAAEEALRQSQKMEAVGQLSGGIAHDFNNLLSIIKGNLQLLQRRLEQGRSDVQRYVTSANEGVERAASLTRRILAFSRRQPLSPQPVDLSALALGMKDFVGHSVGDRVNVVWKLEATSKILCDANLMENAILNLCINARDAMPQGGTLTIETRDVRVESRAKDLEGAEPGDYTELCIADTGTGMTEEVRKRALDPFFTTKPQGQGTGLGLSMTFGFVRQSQGYMTINSVPDYGTTISILMPRCADDTLREVA